MFATITAVQTTVTSTDAFARNVLGWNEKPVVANVSSLAWIDGDLCVAVRTFDGNHADWWLCPVSETALPVMAFPPSAVADAEIIDI